MITCGDDFGRHSDSGDTTGLPGAEKLGIPQCKGQTHTLCPAQLWIGRQSQWQIVIINKPV